MYKNNRLQEKYLKLQRNKKSSQETEDVPKVVANVQISKEENDVAQNNCDNRIPGHSTPVRTKNYTSNVEDSPETEYHCSPIPCTQDGGNDVAWDWQNSKPPHDKSKMQCGVETPKRTKQLQKKRNSNSPLLYKPVKRKLAKVERMESIGKFAAELKALTEKMKDIHKNDGSHNEDEIVNAESTETNIIVELDGENNEINVQDNTDKEKNSESSSAYKMSSSYADLFDDAADDFMVRCSQEVEARLLDCIEKSHSAETSVKSEGKERSASSESISTKGIFNESKKNTSGQGIRNSCVETKIKSVNQIGDCITSVTKKTDVKMSIINGVQLESKNLSAMTEKDTQSLRNNANSINSDELLTIDMSESFEFPDDSFDDCLATCVDEEKLISRINEYDDTFPDEDEIKKPYGNSYKNISSKFSNIKKNNAFVPKISVTPFRSENSEYRASTVANHKTYGGSVRNDNSSCALNDPKKFLKVKSLSESNVECDDNISLDRINSASLSQGQKEVGMNLQPGNTAATHLFVNANLASKERKSVSDGNISVAIDKASTCERLSVNRFMQKDGSKHIVRHNSDISCFNNNAKEAYTQPQRCTPEEIERKRLEAKMRLETKRRQLLNSNGSSVVKLAPVMRPVKR